MSAPHREIAIAGVRTYNESRRWTVVETSASLYFKVLCNNDCYTHQSSHFGGVATLQLPGHGVTS